MFCYQIHRCWQVWLSSVYDTEFPDKDQEQISEPNLLKSTTQIVLSLRLLHIKWYTYGHDLHPFSETIESRFPIKIYFLKIKENPNSKLQILNWDQCNKMFFEGPKLCKIEIKILSEDKGSGLMKKRGIQV